MTTEYADITFTRHKGRGITVDHAPPHTRIALQALMDPSLYLRLLTPDTIVIADQVVYRAIGWDPALCVLELELAEDWRPATQATDEYETLKAVHPVTVIDTEEKGQQP